MLRFRKTNNTKWPNQDVTLRAFCIVCFRGSKAPHIEVGYNSYITRCDIQSRYYASSFSGLMVIFGPSVFYLFGPPDSALWSSSNFYWSLFFCSVSQHMFLVVKIKCQNKSNWGSLSSITLYCFNTRQWPC